MIIGIAGITADKTLLVLSAGTASTTVKATDTQRRLKLTFSNLVKTVESRSE